MRTFLLLLALMAAPLCAQTVPAPTASGSKESFVLEPTGLATGARDAYVRMISNTPAGFTSSSSRQPEVKFSDGVTFVTGSFKLLNSNEAECRVNVEADAMGVCEVSLVFYSVNGTSVLSTQRATLGLLGPTKLGGIDVSVESVPVVRVNVTDVQSAGVIVLSGQLGGVVTLTAPTGARFSKAPVALTNKGTISGPVLAESNTQFSFTINSGQADTLVRVTEISYDTSLFTTTGGVLGALNCQVSGAALAGSSTLVANAHTALTTIAGTNDNADAATPTGSQPSGSTDTGSTPTNTGGTSVNNPVSSSRPLDNNRTNQNNNRNNQPGASRNTGGQPVNSGAQARPSNAPNEIPPQQPQNPGYQPPTDRRDPPANPARPVPAGPNAPSGSDGSAGFSKTLPGEERTPTGVEEPAAVLITTPGIYFCDKDFKPLDLVVLNATVSDKAGSRVWISVKLKADKTAEIDTIEVTLRVCGVSRTLKLTETGKTTGEFRCEKAGVLLVSSEDPDSSVTEEKISEPKARPSGYAK
jgi:hypothetical protein